MTRREYVKYGGVVAGGGLLAGCTGDDSGKGQSDGSDGSEGGETYTASMAPVGDVEFTAVPESVMVYSLLYADMAVAYGHGESVNSLGFDAETGGNTLDAYYEALDGVAFDREGLAQLNTGSGQLDVGKELFYELNSDLHLVDPCLVLSFDGWESADVDEIERNIGPWFGNTLSRDHAQPPEECREDYEYYTLWEIAQQVAGVFRTEDRFEALAAVHSELLETIESNLPPEEERPTVATVIFMDGTFYPTRSDTPGFANAHVRPLGAPDALAGEEITGGTSYGYETMLEFDPDVLLHEYGIASYYDVGAIAETLADHPVGSQLSAVESGRVYPSGDPVQGPLMNLFQLEMTAKQLYPEVFGEWPEYAAGEPYPEIPAEEQLFDRAEVAEIVTGEA
ncbi:ferrichrome-binding protein [Halalkalicoccus jeotgali B3]|uniref:Ferrichrome-binding protein n=1 Tax=Halalkalicoccus jeotgali (strain DSM 18796 / CECT 7217 / JCM 14584 / KCTC 4019 / B3) TaxID=795797 RepID=D8J873_HALJB|nr:ferrichrome-binding protein [Halalkalicoccus jeotgali B3]ELY34632.1 ferrichrome-binding protein [Halalkalicoccus jeotgali B3]